MSSGISSRVLPWIHGAGVGAAAALTLALHASGAGLAPTLVAIVAMATLSGLFSHRMVANRARGLAHMRSALDSVSRGEMSDRLETAQMGELYETAAAVNRVLDVLAATRQRVADMSEGLTRLPGQVEEALEQIQRSAGDQEGAVEETAALHANLNASIRSINGEVDGLARANEESASSILELGTAVEQVARALPADRESHTAFHLIDDHEPEQILLELDGGRYLLHHHRDAVQATDGRGGVDGARPRRTGIVGGQQFEHQARLVTQR